MSNVNPNYIKQKEGFNPLLKLVSGPRPIVVPCGLYLANKRKGRVVKATTVKDVVIMLGPKAVSSKIPNVKRCPAISFKPRIVLLISQQHNSILSVQVPPDCTIDAGPTHSMLNL